MSLKTGAAEKGKCILHHYKETQELTLVFISPVLCEVYLSAKFKVFTKETGNIDVITISEKIKQ